MARTPDENLADLALFIWLPVADAIRAQFVMWAAHDFFEHQPDQRQRFRTHPSNTFPFRALRALEQQSLVYISETLSDKHGIFPTNAAVRRLDLELHRDVISHPTNTSWRRADRQAFFDADRPWTDIRAGIIWDVQKSINTALRANGQKEHNTDIVIAHDMAVTLHSILAIACGDDFSPPQAADLFEWLTGRKPHYVGILEAHPSG